MPSTTNPPTISFLSNHTMARNRLLDEIRIGAELKKSTTREKSLIAIQGRVVSVVREKLTHFNICSCNCDDYINKINFPFW
jgi:hypothetical protein